MRGGKRKGAGRPKKQKEEVISEIISIGLSKKQKEKWKLLSIKQKKNLLDKLRRGIERIKIED